MTWGVKVFAVVLFLTAVACVASLGVLIYG